MLRRLALAAFYVGMFILGGFLDRKLTNRLRTVGRQVRDR